MIISWSYWFSVRKLGTVVFLTILNWWGSVSGLSAEVHHLASAQAFSNAQGAETIFVDAHISTWKTKGVMYWDVEGSLMTILTQVGFSVVRSDTEPHDLTLRVDYQELKGQPFAVNRFGTIIEAHFVLSHTLEGPLFEINIRETSQPSVTGTPPYIDVLLNFLSNPYYHFLGEIVWGETHGAQDPQGILIHSMQAEALRLQTRVEFDPVSGHTARPQHSMPLDKDQYAPLSFRRTIDELVKAGDIRLIGILEDMLRYPDVYVQVRSIEAYGEFRVKEAIPFLDTLRTDNQRVEVRSAAQKTIELLTSSPD